MTLPAAFDPASESVKPLVCLKKAASKDFKPTKQTSLQRAEQLAWGLYIHGREDEALEVCRTLGEVPFTGNFNLWSWIERSLALQSRILRLRGKRDEASACVKRIREAGIAEGRLDGSLLCHREIDAAVQRGDLKGEKTWRCVQLDQLCFNLELGGSAPWPPSTLESEFRLNLDRVRQLAGISPPRGS